MASSSGWEQVPEGEASVARDGFSARTIDQLAKRAASTCSNPDCRQITSGPSSDPEQSTNVGVAAHIRAASPGGPRYDASMTPEARSSAENGILLCQRCAKLVDDDPARYTAFVLLSWKAEHESETEERVRAGGRRTEPATGTAQLPPHALQFLHALAHSTGAMEGEVMVHASGMKYEWDVLGALDLPSLGPRLMARVTASMRSLEDAGLGTIARWKDDKPAHFALTDEGWAMGEALRLAPADYWWNNTPEVKARKE